MDFSPLCSTCWAGIKRYNGPSCRVCARPLISEHSRVCGDCVADPPYFSSVDFYGLYSECLATAINLLKFSGIRRLSRPLAGLLLELPIPVGDVIIPVPMTKRSLLRRGFNQSLLIAKEVSAKTGIPVDMDSLQKTKETLPQVGLDGRERLRNLKGAFSVKRNIGGKRVLLVDDVMTTGATLRECAKALLEAGAIEVSGLVLARTSSEI